MSRSLYYDDLWTDLSSDQPLTVLKVAFRKSRPEPNLKQFLVKVAGGWFLQFQYLSEIKGQSVFEATAIYLESDLSQAEQDEAFQLLKFSQVFS